MVPEVSYARSGDVSIADQVVGDGPFDLVWTPGALSHLELRWEDEAVARFYRALSSFCRLITFDKRGTGLSDRVAGIADLETLMDDIRAVMDAATVLFTDLVGSTAKAAEVGDRRWRDLLEQHHARIRTQLSQYRGVELDTAGDGFFARFDGPARAIRCACSIRDAVSDLGLEVRAGLHTGECEVVDGKVAGLAVSIGAHVGAQAGPGEVFVSQTVKDLVAGPGIEFQDRGGAELKGVPGEWRLYSVASAEAVLTA